MKNTHKLSCPCPSCNKSMTIAALECRDCDLTLQGQFESHPLMKLDAEMLHFLHVFIVCEGKIADMEKALGISYPTVKNKIQKLKDSVSSSGLREEQVADSGLKLESKSVIEILELMNSGLINYKKGLALIKQKKESKR